eukprot:gene1068-10587_t
MEIPKLKTDTDILIQIHAASLNPIDFKLREGATKALRTQEFPLLMGYDASGIVADVGEKVTKFKKGDQVFSRVVDTRIGTFAEYIVSDEFYVAKKPDNMIHIEAASIPLVGLTVLQCFKKAKTLKEKERVLILGGAGGVGTFAIQYAKKVLNLYVITTCSEKKSELCKSLGADEIIDYRKDDFTKVLKDNYVDFIFDTTGEAEKSFCITKTNGKCCSIATMPAGYEVTDITTSFIVPMILDVASKIRLHAYMSSIDYEHWKINR